MKTSNKELTTDYINSKSENETLFNLRFVFPGNSKIKVENDKIILKSLKRERKENGNMIKELSDYIIKNKPDCVLVSGGIDSSILAVIAKKEFKKIKLVSAGTNECEDLKFSIKLANSIDEKLSIAEINEKNIFEAVKALKSMQISTYDIIMGITEFIAIKKAAELGCKRIMSGLGSDELFFGFNKHKHIEENKLEDYREEKLFYMPAFDLLRINSIAANFKVSILLPYLSDNFIDIAKSQVKIEYNDKALLRLIGKEIGLNKELIERNKKAMQYGSGTVKMLRDLSKKKNKMVGELIKEI